MPAPTMGLRKSTGESQASKGGLKRARKQSQQPGLRAKYQPEEVPMVVSAEVSGLRITPTNGETVRVVHGISPLHHYSNIHPPRVKVKKFKNSHQIQKLVVVILQILY